VDAGMLIANNARIVSLVILCQHSTQLYAMLQLDNLYISITVRHSATHFHIHIKQTDRKT